MAPTITNLFGIKTFATFCFATSFAVVLKKTCPSPIQFFQAASLNEIVTFSGTSAMLIKFSIVGANWFLL